MALSRSTIGTSLLQQFVGKLKAREATPDEILKAEQILQGVITRFCEENHWDEAGENDLRFAASLLDADNKSNTFIKFQKAGESEFFVHFIAMKRIEDQIHMGFALHHVKFLLAPNIVITEKNSWIYRSWFQHMQKPKEKTVDLSLEDIRILENYFLYRAMKKFAEDVPNNTNQLPYEDRKYLTLGSSDS
ncbi:unnamed protein product [Soboliphyme baturini]|uniref:39S ribosomal protein L17, mitochondrial n=1 Tax=Soboliphyme baturini TaxID=241478 RepID=A0A183ICL1_9BILA|nr:unnamed protein product [Soboliphyme baturini]